MLLSRLLGLRVWGVLHGVRICYAALNNLLKSFTSPVDISGRAVKTQHIS